jgi:hypothetical protein
MKKIILDNTELEYNIFQSINKESRTITKLKIILSLFMEVL